MFLGIAIVLLVLGQTLLKEQLGPITTLFYWTTCILSTLAAVICALLDALRSIGQSREERRALLEQTLREIDAERERRRKDAAPGPESR